MKAVVQLVVGLIFMLALTAGLRYVFGLVAGAISGEGIRGMVLWKSDWNDALAEANARHKPVLVEFARESSANCRELAKKSWTRMDIASAASDYEPVLVDIDAHPELAKRFEIATVPSLLVIDAGSQTIIRDGRDQTFSPDELLFWLKPDARPAWKDSAPGDISLNSQKSSFDSQKSSFAP